MEKASARARFIGRGPELAAIDDAISAAGDGRPQVVLISGEAGVGKSRLIQELTARAVESGMLVLTGGCVSSRDDAAPLAPFAEALRGLAAQVGTPTLIELAGPAREALAGLLPGLSATETDDGGRGVMYATAQERLHAHLLDLILRLAERQPLVLEIEDIHWADRATFELLRLLARNLGGSRVLVVATYRVDEEDPERRLPSFLAELQRAGDPLRMALHSFNRAELAEHAHALRGEPLDRAALDNVYERSEGNPFYAEQLLAADPAADMLPDTLLELLEARIGALTPNGRSIVCALAVHATPVAEGQLCTVTGMATDEFGMALRELLDRKLVERRRAGSEDALALRHALLREAAYAELLSAERLAMHAAFARILQPQVDRDADDPFAMAELARHWEAAGEINSAYKAAIRAAHSAESAFSPALAAEQYERALRLRRKLDATERGESDEIELLERAAQAAAGIGSSRSIQLIESALQLVDAEKDPIKAGLLSERLGRYRWHSADGAGALDAYEQAVALVPARPPSSARARVAAGLAQVLMIQARFSESAPWCHEAAEMARAVGDRAIEAHATNTMGMNTTYLGNPERGLAMLHSSKDIAEDIGSVEDVGRALVNIVDVLRVWGRLDEAAQFGSAAFQFQREHGLTTIFGVAGLVDAAWSLHWLARWTEARALIDEARRYPSDVNDQIMCLVIGAVVEACQGELELAESHLEMARPLLANVFDTQLLMPHAEAAAETALQAATPHLAIQVVGDALARAQQPVGANVARFGPVYWLGLRATADSVVPPSIGSDEGDGVRARAVARLCWDEITRLRAEIASQSPAFAPLGEAFWALCYAEKLRWDGQNEPSAWADAAERLSALGLRYLYAYSRWREGVALLRASGRGREARRALVDAHLVATEIGARPLQRDIEAIAVRAQIRLSDSSTLGPESEGRPSLTAREVEVLRLLSTGQTNRQIGQELFITEKTASVHVSNIMSKLGASRRGEAVAMAAELGLGRPRSDAGE